MLRILDSGEVPLCQPRSFRELLQAKVISFSQLLESSRDSAFIHRPAPQRSPGPIGRGPSRKVALGISHCDWWRHTERRSIQVHSKFTKSKQGVKKICSGYEMIPPFVAF
jgi:hypothetical protein